MEIAVTSQNFRTVTGHGGESQRFLIFDARPGTLATEVGRLDLPIELSFHECAGRAHPLDGVDALITGSAGMGFIRKLAIAGWLPRLGRQSQFRLSQPGLVNEARVLSFPSSPDLCPRSWVSGY
jgi:hypothetical protein